MKLTFLSFWGINASLNAAALNTQMDEMRRLGLDGVVFHPRYYPGKPAYLSQEYMDILSQVILHAKDTGMAFWLYDENGWPSGSAGGEVLKLHPEFRIRMLNEDLTVMEEAGISAVEKGVVDAFIQLTHERYASMLLPEAFAYVSGFFTDEVAFCSHGCSISHGCVPWCADMPERFRNHALFGHQPGGETLRAEYWEYVTELMQDRFYRPIRRWCEAHGKQYTGHLKAEENPYFQVSFSGSVISSLMGFTLPGIDALERHMTHTCFPRIPASLSMQFGDGHAMCEAMGGSGWGTTPQDEEAYLLALAELGIDTFVLHIQQFRLDENSLNDWPPSRPCDLNWREVYPEMLRRVRCKASRMDAFRKPDALIVMPARGAMAGFFPSESRNVNEHDGDELPDVPAARNSFALLALTDVLYHAGWRYDLTDEATYEREAVIDGSFVQLGKRRYSQVLLASGVYSSMDSHNTPRQSAWRITGFDGKREIPSECRKKDDRHFLCCFDHPSAASDDCGNLIASGYGFCSSVTLEKEIILEDDWSNATLMLTGVDASALTLNVDGLFAGYVYGADWSLNGMNLAAGSHVLTVTLYNSGYNIHGPHHYYLGDYSLVSPLHIKGEKHFGDLPDAPINTHIPEWHFVNYRLFGSVHLLQKQLREE